MTIRNFTLVFVLSIVAAAVWIAPVGAQQNPYAGRWNLIGTGENAGSVYWLEVKDDGGKLTGTFLNRTSSPFPLVAIKIENGELVFNPRGRNAETPGPEFRAKADGDKLTGSVKMDERTLTFTGVRPYTWPAFNANAKHTFGAPVDLFDGKSLDAWDVQHKNRPIKWSVVEGVMANETPGGNNLVSKAQFKDFKIVAEYKLDKDSNSGIYVRGRYELQVLDDFGKPADKNSHMSIYGRTGPT